MTTKNPKREFRIRVVSSPAAGTVLPTVNLLGADSLADAATKGNRFSKARDCFVVDIEKLVGQHWDLQARWAKQKGKRSSFVAV